MTELAIIGAGGFGREVKHWATDSNITGLYNYTFYVDDKYAKGDIRPLSQLDGLRSFGVIAVGYPKDRQRIANRIRSDVKYTKLIHNTAICDKDSLGVGAILCPYTVITVNCKIGRHFHANLHSDVGHDCVIGHYVTLAPSARVSGNCTIGDRVYIGSNAVIREGVTICDDVTIGAGAVVLNDITESGVYVGMPAKRKETQESIPLGTYFLKANLVDFGNFLLSCERKSDSDMVTDADYQNWIAKQKAK